MNKTAFEANFDGLVDRPTITLDWHMVTPLQWSMRGRSRTRGLRCFKALKR